MYRCYVSLPVTLVAIARSTSDARWLRCSASLANSSRFCMSIASLLISAQSSASMRSFSKRAVISSIVVSRAEGRESPSSQLGGLTPSASRPEAPDFRGASTIFVSIKLHLGHSKVRFSDPFPRCSLLASIIRIWHLGQRGRSSGPTGKMDGSVMVHRG